ncbi:hydrogenase maturation protein HypF [Methanomicrobium sp. W14]|uniref:carbamoyltransferase HypF n=1 Tax=Methanomicrobium sp. W14 TaxID=2817839 RepID=UPI001AE59811|nr:carbamoyltransferase HypF [Methanomicrobium sp. W14]MBP2133031.1 hydrogenase maturation protein HypF [Methanomicrobium sp. W14]
MRKNGQIIIKGIVQGVGFRPFVYSQAAKYQISGSVKNLGSEVRINAFGDKFEDFLSSLYAGTPLSKIDSITVTEAKEEAPKGFRIEKSSEGSLSGFIPQDVAICKECISDIFKKGGRYENYWATSCVNCGPRYSIIKEVPYDRERTTMDNFPMCPECSEEYSDPHSRRHHAQTIACEKCGPALSLLDKNGNNIQTADPIEKTACLLDSGKIVAIKGIGGFHIACCGESAPRLKQCLGRSEQALAIMAKEDFIQKIAEVSDSEKEILNSPEHPIVVLYKKKHDSYMDISNLDTIGCMLPYSGLHHLIFSKLKSPYLIMTSANAPGNPMVTETEEAILKLDRCVDFFLTHNRHIQNRCDDSVVREGYLIRLSRGYAPKRTAVDLGKKCILGAGPELYSNISVYKQGFCCTSPHIGNITNPSTLEYLEKTVENLKNLTGSKFDLIAHDLHPQFLSTRFAKTLAEKTGAKTFAVQHHKAHIAAAMQKNEACIGIALDGVGLGDDGTIWGGEIFAGDLCSLKRAAHLETVKMPGGDLATEFPERMLYGIMPTDDVKDLLFSRGWKENEIHILDRQIKTGFNVHMTSSAGRILDAASALLGICRRRTYEGEPAMKLEAAASGGKAENWDLEVSEKDGCFVLSTTDLLKKAYESTGRLSLPDIAASIQYNLAKNFAKIATDLAENYETKNVALSGGVCINHIIRETIKNEISKAGLKLIINREYPFGDGCISYGQCIYAGYNYDK